MDYREIEDFLVSQLVGSFWFFVSVIFFILWRKEKRKNKASNTADQVSSAIVLLFLIGCGSSSTTGTDSPPASIVGTWSLESVQCVSAPSSVCWKTAIKSLGVMTVAATYTGFADFRADGTLTLDLIPKLDSIPGAWRCETGNVKAPHYKGDGTYTAAAGDMQLGIDHYVQVKGSGFGFNYDRHFNNPFASTVASYTITGNLLTITLDIQSEKWIVILKK